MIFVVISQKNGVRHSGVYYVWEKWLKPFNMESQITFPTFFQCTWNFYHCQDSIDGTDTNFQIANYYVRIFVVKSQVEELIRPNHTWERTTDSSNIMSILHTVPNYHHELRPGRKGLELVLIAWWIGEYMDLEVPPSFLFYRSENIVNINAKNQNMNSIRIERPNNDTKARNTEPNLCSGCKNSPWTQFDVSIEQR